MSLQEWIGPIILAAAMIMERVLDDSKVLYKAIIFPLVVLALFVILFFFERKLIFILYICATGLVSIVNIIRMINKSKQ